MKAKPTEFAVTYFAVTYLHHSEAAYTVKSNKFRAIDWMDILANHEGVLDDSNRPQQKDCWTVCIMLELNVLPMSGMRRYKPGEKMDMWRCDVYEVE